MDGSQNRNFSKKATFDVKSILVVVFFAILSVIIIKTCLVRLFPEEDVGFINEQRITVGSEEEEVNEGGKSALEIAGYFCLKEGYNVDQSIFLNTDNDEGSEVAGVCWEGDEYNRDGMLFVLDEQDGEFISIVEKEDNIKSQRYYNFENIDIVDVDEDGLEEIIYGERGWWISGGDSYLYLYSPKHDEWFYRVDKKDLQIVEGETVTNEKTEYSDNLAEGAYPAVKSFLASHFVAGDGSGIVEVEKDIPEWGLGDKCDNYKLVLEYGEKYWDQKLVCNDSETGEVVVLVESVKEALPELKENFNLILYIFAEPEESKSIIFKSGLDGTDNPSGILYSFNKDDLVFSEMKINEVYDGFFGGFAMAPDQTRFAWVPDPYWEKEGNEEEARIMYMVNLVDDGYEPIVILSGNDTFNGGDHAMGVAIGLEWSEADKIVYSVYDASQKEKYDYSDDPKGTLEALLIAKRIYIVQN